MQYIILYLISSLWIAQSVIPLHHLYNENDPNANVVTNEAEEPLWNPADHMRKNKQFSGIYKPPSSTSELYAGAWLAPKRRLLNDQKNIETIVNLEGASFHVVLNDVSVMTRDFLDFQVIHLSSTTNQFPNIEIPKHQEELLFRMQKTVEALEMKDPSKLTHRYKDRRILDQTVVIIPYSNTPASQHIDASKTALSLFSTKMRELYLQATFWSNYRIFPKIIIAFASLAELEAVKALNLPVWKYVDLSYSITNRHLLPKQSLLYVVNKLNQKNITSLDEDKEWQHINYVYYTEADEIITSRYLPYIYALMDRMKGEVAIVPHRMQTIAIPQVYPGIEAAWDNHWPEDKTKKILQAQLVIEDPLIPRGSCCDSGRFKFAPCDTQWWYNCPNWGLQNYPQFIQYGEYGFTMPAGTEHQAKCDYSPIKASCELHFTQNCMRKMPRTKQEVCGEVGFVFSVPSEE